jgi:hypothetical protein
MDLDRTLQACEALHRNIPHLIEDETDFVRAHQVRLILGDIPPVSFEIAARGSIASTSIANFIWSGIYRTYIKTHPAFIPLIEEMKTFYRKATLALRFPILAAWMSFRDKNLFRGSVGLHLSQKNRQDKHFSYPYRRPLCC